MASSGSIYRSTGIMTYRALIVDDEPAACERLNRMLLRINAPCEIIGTAANGFDALIAINNEKPDVVFLDIELPGMNGIEMLRHCMYDPFIIFTTAYDQYAIDAFEAKTVSYLVKPISESRLLTAVNKLIKMVHVPVESVYALLKPLSNTYSTSPLPMLPVKQDSEFILLKNEWIICIRAEGKYTVISTKDKQYISNYSISELEQRLKSVFFLRVHRSYMINLRHVVKLQKNVDGKLHLVTDIPLDEEIIISKNYYDMLKERLDIR